MVLGPNYDKNIGQGFERTGDALRKWWDDLHRPPAGSAVSPQAQTGTSRAKVSQATNQGKTSRTPKASAGTQSKAATSNSKPATSARQGAAPARQGAGEVNWPEVIHGPRLLQYEPLMQKFGGTPTGDMLELVKQADYGGDKMQAREMLQNFLAGQFGLEGENIRGQFGLEKQALANQGARDAASVRASGGSSDVPKELIKQRFETFREAFPWIKDPDLSDDENIWRFQDFMNAIYNPGGGTGGPDPDKKIK